MARRFLLLGSLCSVLAVCGYACSSGGDTREPTIQCVGGFCAQGQPQ